MQNHKRRYTWYSLGEAKIPRIDGLVQERRNPSALAMELRLSSTNPPTWCHGHFPAEISWKIPGLSSPRNVCYILPVQSLIFIRSVMMTSSNGNIFHVTGPLYGEFTGHRWFPPNHPPQPPPPPPPHTHTHTLPHTPTHKGHLRGALMFSLICAWINGYVYNRKASDLRSHRTHCDVTVKCHCSATIRLVSGFLLTKSSCKTWKHCAVKYELTTRLIDLYMIAVTPLFHHDFAWLNS